MAFIRPQEENARLPLVLWAHSLFAAVSLATTLPLAARNYIYDVDTQIRALGALVVCFAHILQETMGGACGTHR